MQFARHLRPRIASGEITCSIRVWLTPRVKVGGRYRLLDGYIRVTSVREIALEDVSDAIARQSGFADVDDLFATARHGKGETIYRVEFVFEPE